MSGSGVGFGMGALGAAGLSEMSKGFSALGSSHDNGVGSFGGSEGELIEGQAFSSGSENSFSGSFSEFKGGHGHLGHSDESLVIKNLVDTNDDLILLSIFDKSG